MMHGSGVLDVLYGGIRPEIPGHGGVECASYLSKSTMIFETLLSTSMMIVVGVFGVFTYSMPKIFPPEKNYNAKKLLLIFLCLVFGIEIGYKICSRQVLYLLNPCHVLTVIEVSDTITLLVISSNYFSRYIYLLQGQVVFHLQS